MESKRLQKVNRLLQRDLGEMLQREGHRYGGMITVTKINVTPDLSLARVNLSLFATNDKNAMLQRIIDNSKEIRFQLGKRIKNQMRVIPELKFHLDDSLDYIDRIDKLLKDDTSSDINE